MKLTNTKIFHIPAFAHGVWKEICIPKRLAPGQAKQDIPKLQDTILYLFSGYRILRIQDPI